MQSRQKQVLVYSVKGRAGSGSAASPQHNPQPSWPSAMAQAETEKLGMEGPETMALGARPGQITI